MDVELVVEVGEGFHMGRTGDWKEREAIEETEETAVEEVEAAEAVDSAVKGEKVGDHPEERVSSMPPLSQYVVTNIQTNSATRKRQVSLDNYDEIMCKCLWQRSDPHVCKLAINNECVGANNKWTAAAVTGDGGPTLHVPEDSVRCN